MCLVRPEELVNSCLRLEECGYLTTFGSDQCTISNESGNIIRQVPHSQNAVYRVVHDGPELTCVAKDMVTWTKLHRRLGHVLQGVAKQLVEKGLVTRVHIDTPSGDIVFCESCVYAKATWKLVVKAQKGEQATELGGVDWPRSGSVRVRALFS